MKGIKYDGEKLRYDLMPCGPLAAIVRVLTFGAQKYEDDNWKSVPEARRRYMAACFRHLEAWRGGETYDPETGENHLAHAACCLVFLIWFDQKGEA